MRHYIGGAPCRQHRRRSDRRHRPGHAHRVRHARRRQVQPTSTAPSPPPSMRSTRAGWAEHAVAGSGPRRCGRSPTRSRRAPTRSAASRRSTPGSRSPRHAAWPSRAAENFRYFADVCSAMHEDAFRTKAQLGYVIRRPRGVAGLITPWNVPFMLATWKLAPCLAAGCTVVLKPAELSPLSASLLPEIMEAAGVPAGVFNIVHGVGEEAGAALVAHPDVPGDLVHRRDHDRQDDHACRRRAPEGAVDGARRQVAVHRVRRRRPRARPRQRPVRCVLAQRRALHGRLADPRRALDLRRVRRASRRHGRRRSASATRPTRPPSSVR